MTYPPPPGVPGDPGQQPMHDPYAPGGGFAPPPVDPYGTPPPTSDPYGTPPQMSDPYGQPPQDPYGQPPQDPYGQPPQDPYGQPPMSGVPMSPGAPGPYGQPPMGGMPGQPPSFLGGQPPQKKSNLGWILGGVGGAAVLIILVVVGIVMFNTSGSSNDNAGGDNKSNEEGGGEESGDGGDDGGEGGGNYKITDGMCEKFDISKLPSSMGVSKFDDISMDDEMYCSAQSSTSAVITVKGKAFADATEAETGYEDYKKNEIVGGDGLTDFSGDWDKGEISQYASLEGTASVFIQNGNMAVTMFISSTEGSTNDEAKEAAVIFAEETFKAASA